MTDPDRFDIVGENTHCPKCGAKGKLYFDYQQEDRWEGSLIYCTECKSSGYGLFFEEDKLPQELIDYIKEKSV